MAWIDAKAPTRAGLPLTTGPVNFRAMYGRGAVRIAALAITKLNLQSSYNSGFHQFPEIWIIARRLMLSL